MWFPQPQGAQDLPAMSLETSDHKNLGAERNCPQRQRNVERILSLGWGSLV